MCIPRKEPKMHPEVCCCDYIVQSWPGRQRPYFLCCSMYCHKAEPCNWTPASPPNDRNKRQRSAAYNDTTTGRRAPGGVQGATVVDMCIITLFNGHQQCVRMRVSVTMRTCARATDAPKAGAPPVFRRTPFLPSTKSAPALR